MEEEGSKKDSRFNPCFVGTSPLIPLVEWKKGIMLPANPPVARSFDGYALRERFMSLRTPQECASFLNEYGRFSPLEKIDREVGWAFETLMKLREVFTNLATRPMEEWSEYANELMSPQENGANIRAVFGALNWSRSAIEFRANQTSLPTLRGAKHIGVIETNDVISAIFTTLQIDQVRGAKFRACARIDCQQFYEVTSNHKRKYCGPDCAHLETVRRLRKRQKSKSRRSAKERAVG